MFSDDELVFIKTMMEDELFINSIKRSHIEDYKRVKEFDMQIKDREDFIKKILVKINRVCKFCGEI